MGEDRGGGENDGLPLIPTFPHKGEGVKYRMSTEPRQTEMIRYDIYSCIRSLLSMKTAIGDGL